MTPRFELFPGHLDEPVDATHGTPIRYVKDAWYWRYRERNGRITAIGGEAYSTKSNARRAVRRHETAMREQADSPLQNIVVMEA